MKSFLFTYITIFITGFITAADPQGNCEQCVLKKKCLVFGQMTQREQQAWLDNFICVGSDEYSFGSPPGFAAAAKGDYLCCSYEIWGTNGKLAKVLKQTNLTKSSKTDPDYSNNYDPGNDSSSSYLTNTPNSNSGISNTNTPPPYDNSYGSNPASDSKSDLDNPFINSNSRETYPKQSSSGSDTNGKISWNQPPNKKWWNSRNPNVGNQNTGNPGLGSPNFGNQFMGMPNFGNQNSGFPNFGDQNSGIPNFGTQNSFFPNFGSLNNGIPNFGNQNSGIPNYSNQNSGIPNFGNQNSGIPKYGNQNSGIPNFNNQNSGIPNFNNQNSGLPNYDTQNNGIPNFGNQYSGLPNFGNQNSGLPNFGNQNSGLPNFENHNSGFPNFGNLNNMGNNNNNFGKKPSSSFGRNGNNNDNLENDENPNSYNSNPFTTARTGNYGRQGNSFSKFGQCNRVTSSLPDPRSGCCGREASDSDRITAEPNAPTDIGEVNSNENSQSVVTNAPSDTGETQNSSNDILNAPIIFYDNSQPQQTTNSILPIWSFKDKKERHKRDVHLQNPTTKKPVPIANRIAGGTATEFYQFPWTVLLTTIFFDDSGKEIAFNCGGSLISSQYVLTAAHCVSDKHATLKMVKVNLAEYDTRSFPKDCKMTDDGEKCIETIVMEGKDVIIHPQFTEDGLLNDVALIKLNGKAPYTEYIRPICLTPINVDEPQYRNLRLTVAGWGRNGPNRSHRSDVKQSTVVELVPQKQCKKYYPDLTPQHLCAAGYTGEDTCKGDSGGPLMTLYRGKYYVVGIVSGKRADSPCGTSVPSLYTNVYHYLHWIRNNVRN